MKRQKGETEAAQVRSKCRKRVGNKEARKK